MNLSSPAIKHLVVFNMACGILKVRKFEDVVAKAVNITKDKKVLNQQRKTLVKVEAEIDKITSHVDRIFSQLSHKDLMKIQKGHTPQLIQTIPEETTNPELLGLYLLFVEFQDLVDSRLDPLLKPLTEIDYMSLIITISEEIGLEKDVADEMFELATHLIGKINK